MRRLWAQFVRRAPRRLFVNAAGKLLLVLSVALGVLAINTANNGLFLAWGLAMGVIVVSGILSELSLRALSAQLAPTGPLRVGSLSQFDLTLHNASQSFGAYALEAELSLANMETPVPNGAVVMPLVLALPKASSARLSQSYRPKIRGALRAEEVLITTSYPFGFFAKARRIAITPQLIWVWPARIEQNLSKQSAPSELGDALSSVSGTGDEFFALRPWRPGEDLRRLVWRRLARTGRPFVVEHAREMTQEVVLVGHIDAQAPTPVQERAIAALGTIAEDLLNRGVGIGMRVNGFLLEPSTNSAYRAQIVRMLDGLAQLDVRLPLAPPSAKHRSSTPQLFLIGSGFAQAPEGVQTLELNVDKEPDNMHAPSEKTAADVGIS